MASEQKIQNDILLELNQRGHRVWRSNAGRVRNEQGFYINLFPKGFPDLVGYRKDDGRFLVIEVKNKTGRLSPAQEKFKEFAQTQPIIYGVARTVKEAIRIVEGN